MDMKVIDGFGDPDANSFYDELNSSGDRAAAIVAGAVLEDQLRILLSSFCREDLSNKYKKKIFEGAAAPFGAASGRTLASYCFDLIDLLTYQNLSKIQSIRNKFAHGKPGTSFSELIIKKKVMDLKPPIKLEEELGRDPRSRFVYTVVIYFSTLRLKIAEKFNLPRDR